MTKLKIKLNLIKFKLVSKGSKSGCLYYKSQSGSKPNGSSKSGLQCLNWSWQIIGSQ